MTTFRVAFASAAALLALTVLPAIGPAYSQSRDGAQRDKPAAAQPQKSATKATAKPAADKTHKLAIQVDENKPEVMNLALNNAKNVFEYYKAKGEEVAVEIVTFGPGLHMLRDDTSPVKPRIAQMALEEPNLVFTACANTLANQTKQEQKTITLISDARLQPSGVVRLMELQGQGYAYVRP